MAANYYCILFDLDGTLLDFVSAEQVSIASTLEAFELPADEEVCAQFSAINASLWEQLEKGQIKKDKLSVMRFSMLLEKLGMAGDAIRMNNDYMTRLSAAAMPFAGAKELLEELSEFATLAVTSNGNQSVQESRLEKSGLAPYFDEIFVSEKLGVTKPQARFFDTALRRLGIKSKEKVLVVGDSLTADIQGGINAGLDTCWCNFTNAENTLGIAPTYTVQGYEQLKLVAVGEEELKRAESREKRHLV
ncbi:MAG: YjjG family noncanonical pyrimidine nucleotidase [Oscillospiraceae bacterium]